MARRARTEMGAYSRKLCPADGGSVYNPERGRKEFRCFSIRPGKVHWSCSVFPVAGYGGLKEGDTAAQSVPVSSLSGGEVGPFRTAAREYDYALTRTEELPGRR